MSSDPRPPSAPAPACANCYSHDHWILHNVKHRGLFKKLCTSCVLKLHPSSFCPTCFSLHDPNSLIPIPSSSSSISGAGKTLTCFKCSSLSHSTCVPPNVPKSPYLCPPCSNPSFKFFDIRNHQSRALQDEQNQKRVFDENSARVLLTAARISSISMNKAAITARENAERRARDSALARKRAREAMDHVMALSARFAGNKRRETTVTEVPVPVSATSPANVKAVIPVKMDKSDVGRVISVASNAAAQLSEKSNGSQSKVNHGH